MDSKPSGLHSASTGDSDGNSSRARRPRDREPLQIPDHTLLRCIGRGAYGEVWLARNVLNIYRAVKVVYRDTFDDERPFEREFSGIQKCEPVSRSQEGLVDILHVGRYAEYFYYVMELADDPVSGQAVNPEGYAPRTLRSELNKRKRLPP